MVDKNERGPIEYYTSEEMLKELSEIQNLFSIDEMPPFRIKATTPNFTKYKCRKTYFVALNGLMDFIDFGANPEIKNDCANYRNFMKSTIANRGSKPENWIRREDINTADNFLSVLKKHFERK